MCCYYRLSSPYYTEYSTGAVTWISYSGYIQSDGYNMSRHSLRPVICLPSNLLEKNKTTDKWEIKSIIEQNQD